MKVIRVINRKPVSTVVTIKVLTNKRARNEFYEVVHNSFASLETLRFTSSSNKRNLMQTAFAFESDEKVS